MTQMSQIGQDARGVPPARDEQTHRIIGAAMTVHSELGPGFLEPVYQSALARELTDRAIPFVREAPLAIFYKGVPLDCTYRADFICFDEIIVELKAQASIGAVEQAQVLNYLKATNLKRALLLNFCAQRLEYKRIVNGFKASASSATSAVRKELR